MIWIYIFAAGWVIATSIAGYYVLRHRSQYTRSDFIQSCLFWLGVSFLAAVILVVLPNTAGRDIVGTHPVETGRYQLSDLNVQNDKFVIGTDGDDYLYYMERSDGSTSFGSVDARSSAIYRDEDNHPYIIEYTGEKESNFWTIFPVHKEYGSDLHIPHDAIVGG